MQHHTNYLSSTIAAIGKETDPDIDHYVIGSDDAEILDGTYNTVEEAHAKVLELVATGDHFKLDIEARDVDGDMLGVYTVFEDYTDEEDEEDEEEEK